MILNVVGAIVNGMCSKRAGFDFGEKLLTPRGDFPEPPRRPSARAPFATGGKWMKRGSCLQTRSERRLENRKQISSRGSPRRLRHPNHPSNPDGTRAEGKAAGANPDAKKIEGKKVKPQTPSPSAEAANPEPQQAQKTRETKF